MTKKYKHKQTGDVVQSSCEKGYYKNVNIPMGTLIPGKYIENSCDWEEVVEKDYEILSFIHKNSYKDNYVIRMKNGMLDSPDQKLPESHYLNSTSWSIHSIKRLSDGCVFTVGDKVTQGKINKIILNQNTVYLELF